MFRLSIVAAMTVGLCGCTSTTPAMRSVEVVGSQQAISGCKFITSVRGDQNLIGGVMFQGAAYNDAINQMKKRTIEAGGNRLYVVNATAGLGGANAIGDAYKCP